MIVSLESQLNSKPTPDETAVVEWFTGSSRAFRFAVGTQGVILGSAPGCDIRIGLPNPPLLGLLRYEQGELILRVLAPQISLVVDSQPAGAQTSLAQGSSFSLGDQKARVLFLSPWQSRKQSFPALPEPQTQKPFADLPDNQNPLWEPVLAQLNEEAEKIRIRQEELASLSEALETQARAIDWWHNNLVSEEKKLQERVRLLGQRENEIEKKAADLPDNSLEASDIRERKRTQQPSPIWVLPDDPVQVFFPVPEDLAPDSTSAHVSSHDGVNEPNLDFSTPGPVEYSLPSGPEEHTPVNSDWPEDESWDFLHSNSEPTVPLNIADPVELPTALDQTAAEETLTISEEVETPTETAMSPPVVPSTQEQEMETVFLVTREIQKAESARANASGDEPEEPFVPARDEIGTAEPFADNISAKTMIRELPALIVPGPIRNWRWTHTFEEWFLSEFLNLETATIESLLSRTPPADNQRPTQSIEQSGSLFSSWIEAGWIQSDLISGFIDLSKTAGTSLEGWLEQNHPGAVDWLGETGNIQGKFRIGPYLVFAGNPPDEPSLNTLRCIDPTDGKKVFLLAKPTSSPVENPGPHVYWETLTKLEHENVALYLGSLDHGGKTWGVWEEPLGRNLGDLTRISPALGIWYRLFLQATLGVRSLHQEGLTHGGVNPESFILQPGGVLNFCHPLGLKIEKEATNSGQGLKVQKDLGDLGNLGWQLLERMFGKHSHNDWKKWIPATLWELLFRLDPLGPVLPKVTTTDDLAHELDRLGLQIRSNPFSWASFLDRQFPGRQNLPAEPRRISA